MIQAGREQIKEKRNNIKSKKKKENVNQEGDKEAWDDAVKAEWTANTLSNNNVLGQYGLW